MDIFGINNENGYFPESFFADGLDGEIAEPRAQWAEGPATGSPVARLETFSTDFLASVARIRKAGSGSQARELRNALSHNLLVAMGYKYNREVMDHALGTTLPSLGQVADPDGRDLLWIVEAPLPPSEDAAADPLSLNFAAEQFPEDTQADAELEEPIDQVVGQGIFALSRPPKYVLVVGLTQLVLCRRYCKDTGGCQPHHPVLP